MSFDFDKSLRAEPGLNVTVRTLRLMAALSERSGFASMSVEHMALQLGAKKAAIRQARQKVVALGFFHKPKAWKYHRRKLAEDETKTGFWDRMQKDSRLDPTARCAFLLCDLTKKHDTITISLSELAYKLDVHYDLSRAVKRILELEKHFIRRKIDGGRYSYQRKWGHYDPAMDDNTEDHDDAQKQPEPDYSYLDQNTRSRRRHAAGTAGRGHT